MNRRLFLASLLAQLEARSQDSQRPSAPRLPVFTAVTRQSGIRFKNEASHPSRKYLLEPMPGGVAMLDYEGAGRLDLFFVNGAPLDDPMPAGKTPDKSNPRYWNRLYHNNGD